VTLVAQGDTDSTRDGDAINMTSLQLRYLLQVNYALNVGTPTSVRVILFQWMETGVPSMSTVLVDPTDTNTFFVHDNRSQYKILYDATHCIGPESNVATQPGNGGNPLMLTRSVRVSPARKRLAFLSATTTGIGHIYVVIIQSLSSTAADQFNCLSSFRTRLLYTDS